MIAELRKPIDPDDIDSDNKLIVLFQKIIPIGNWNDFNSFPKWRIREIIAFYQSEADEGRFYNYTASGIISVFNSIMSNINENTPSD